MRRRGEGGASLVLVLVFTTVLSLVIGAVLSLSSTAQKTTGVSAAVTNAVYAVDSGVEFGISHLRDGKGFCATVNGEIQLPEGFAGGQDVTVTCSGAESKQIEQGVSSYAVITFSPGPASLKSQSGTGVEKQVSGRTFVNGLIDLKAALRVNAEPPPPRTVGLGDGLVVQSKLNGCQPKPGNLVGGFQPCSGLTIESVDPKPALPPAAGLTPRGFAPVATPTVDGVQCGIFLPGKYTSLGPSGSALELLAGSGTANYMASGIYYFENVGRININHPGNLRLFGGDLGADKKTLPDKACATDAQAGVATGDKGVQIILGGNSWIDVGKADVEFATYQPNGGGPGRGVSIRTVPTGTDPVTGYRASTPSGALNGVGLRTTTGNNPHFSVHGLVYAPNAQVEINDTNTSAAQILGGVMAWTLDINASASAADLIIQVTGERPKSRSKVVIEASVPVSGTKTVKARAVVDVQIVPPPRTISDGATHSNTNITALASAPFMDADIGSAIFGSNIPPNAFIVSRSSASSISISAPTTTTVPADISPVELTIDPAVRTVRDGVLTASKTVTSENFNFTTDDVGGTIFSIGASGDPDTRIPPGTTIEKVVDEKTVILTAAANPSGFSDSNVTLRVDRRRVAVTTVSRRVENP